MAYKGAVTGAHVFLKNVMKARIKPPISPPKVQTIGGIVPVAIMFQVIAELATKRISRAPVLFTAPEIVIWF